MVFFCVLAQGRVECKELRVELHEMVVIALGKQLAPKGILFVSDLPRTRNAKVMRRVIQAAYWDQNRGDTT